MTESRGRRAVRRGDIGDLDELVALRRSALYLLTRDAFEQRMARPDARRFGAWVGVVDGHAPTAGGQPREPRS